MPGSIEVKAEKTVPEDTKLDEYPLPDNSISGEISGQLTRNRKDLLPLSADRACELTDELTVYAVLPDGNLETPFSGWNIRQYPPDTVFAVSKREWEKSMSFHVVLNDRMNYQSQRERNFLRHTGDCFAVYHQRNIANIETPGYIPLETARADGLSPRNAGYTLVYTASLTGKADIAKLEKQFKKHPPVDFHCRSVSPGDIIAIKDNGHLKAWYPDRLAFTEMPGLFENMPLYRTGKQGEHLPLMDEIPVYFQTKEYAYMREELQLYFASQNANIACRDAVDNAISTNYHDWCLDTGSAVRQVRDEFGYERMLYVLTVSIHQKSWDGRIARENVQWAENVLNVRRNNGENRDFQAVISKCHPGLLDLFVSAARHEYEKSRPLSAEEITAEAERIFTELKALKNPNGVNHPGFVVQFSQKFVSRANEGDYVMLSSMMPFKSFEITSMRDIYSCGMFAKIAEDEKRESKHRLKKPLYRTRRTAAKQKKKEPER